MQDSAGVQAKGSHLRYLSWKLEEDGSASARQCKATSCRGEGGVVSAHKSQHCHIAESHSRLSNWTVRNMHGDSQRKSKWLLVSPSSLVRTGCREGTEQL